MSARRRGAHVGSALGRALHRVGYGRGIDNALWHRSFANNVWSAWESLGGTLSSEPAVVSWAPGRIDVFARGMDGSLIHKWYQDTLGWGAGWENLGGQIIGAPGALSLSAGHLGYCAEFHRAGSCWGFRPVWALNSLHAPDFLSFIAMSS